MQHPSASKRLAVTILASVLLLGWDVSHRIALGARYLTAHQIELDSPAVLKHMRLNHEEADYFQRIAAVVSDLNARHPGKTVLNLTPDALYTTFDWGTREFGQIPVVWPSFFEIAYPDFPSQLCRRVEREQPILIAPPTLARPTGYCRSTYVSYAAKSTESCGTAADGDFFASGCARLKKSHCPITTPEVRFDEPCDVQAPGAE